MMGWERPEEYPPDLRESLQPRRLIIGSPLHLGSYQDLLVVPKMCAAQAMEQP